MDNPIKPVDVEESYPPKSEVFHKLSTGFPQVIHRLARFRPLDAFPCACYTSDEIVGSPWGSRVDAPPVLGWTYDYWFSYI